jgi:hypothetical protein
VASESAETDTGIPHGHDMALRGGTVLKSRDAAAARRLKEPSLIDVSSSGNEIVESRNYGGKLDD